MKLKKLADWYLKSAEEFDRMAENMNLRLGDRCQAAKCAARERRTAEACLSGAPTAQLVMQAEQYDCQWCGHSHPSWIPPETCPLHR